MTSGEWRNSPQPATLDAVETMTRMDDGTAFVVHGAEDPRPPPAATQVADALNAATVRIIDGAGHHPWRERPEQLADVLRGFAGEVR